MQALSGYQVKSMDPFSPVSKKTSATFTSPDGKDMMACKGAPQVISLSLNSLGCWSLFQYMKEVISTGEHQLLHRTYLQSCLLSSFASSVASSYLRRNNCCC